MDANEIKMVIFDMDGLMLDTERCYYNGVKEMCEKKQIKVDMSIYRAVIGTSEAIDMEKFNKSTYPNDALEKMICQYVDNRRKELCEEGVAIKKGLRELLNILNKRNILRAVATSTPKPIAEKLLERVGIKKEFSVIVSATDVKKGKPAPDIFSSWHVKKFRFYRKDAWFLRILYLVQKRRKRQGYHTLLFQILIIRKKRLQKQQKW